MLNLEYARLVDADRRRAAEERIRTDRLLHPDQASVDVATARIVTRHPQARCRGAAGTAR